MQTHAAPAEAGTLEQNKGIVRRFVAEIFVAGRPEAVDELVAEDFVPHSWPSTGDRRGDLKRAIDARQRRPGGPEFTVEDLIAEGDRVAARLTTSATHVGEFMGMAATGSATRSRRSTSSALRDGQVIEHWHQFNPLALMQQLGVSPPG